MDTKIAELLGWTDIRQTGLGYEGFHPDDDIRLIREVVPDFHTSWCAMKEVVEAMRVRGWAIRLSLDSGCSWSVGFHQYDPLVFKFAHSDSLPHAVCEAAVKAMEADETS